MAFCGDVSNSPADKRGYGDLREHHVNWDPKFLGAMNMSKARRVRYDSICNKRSDESCHHSWSISRELSEGSIHDLQQASTISKMALRRLPISPSRIVLNFGIRPGFFTIKSIICAGSPVILKNSSP
jgi:hypothetical protein